MRGWIARTPSVYRSLVPKRRIRLPVPAAVVVVRGRFGRTGLNTDKKLPIPTPIVIFFKETTLYMRCLQMSSVKDVIAQDAFAGHLGIELLSLEPGFSTGEHRRISRFYSDGLQRFLTLL